MPKSQNIRMSGLVLEALGNALFKVELENKHTITCTISGKIRKFQINIMPGDQVEVDLSPYDLTHGRIEFNNRGGKKVVDPNDPEVSTPKKPKENKKFFKKRK